MGFCAEPDHAARVERTIGVRPAGSALAGAVPLRSVPRPRVLRGCESRLGLDRTRGRVPDKIEHSGEIDTGNDPIAEYLAKLVVEQKKREAEDKADESAGADDTEGDDDGDSSEAGPAGKQLCRRYCPPASSLSSTKNFLACPFHHHELLPDLANQARGEIFEVIHGIQNHGIGEPFRIERGHLADQRHQLARIVEIAAKLGFAEGPGGRRSGGRGSRDDRLWILRELMHVHDVRDGP